MTLLKGRHFERDRFFQRQRPQPQIDLLNATTRKRKDIFAWGQLIVNVRIVPNPTEASSRVCGARKIPPFRKRHVFSALWAANFFFFLKGHSVPLTFLSLTSLKRRFFAKLFR